MAGAMDRSHPLCWAPRSNLDLRKVGVKGGCPNPMGSLLEGRGAASRTRVARLGRRLPPAPRTGDGLHASAHGKGSPGPGAKPEPMSEPRAQRTLVKSPPELWAEISDVSTLARHLGAFGEIRITRLENETTVVWEGDRACGTVELEASGWGTKVTITAAAVAAPEQVEPEPEPAAVAEAEAEAREPDEPEPEAVGEPEAEAVPEPEAEAPAVIEPEGE